MTEDFDVTATFLAGARLIEDALADPGVARHWDSPSVLEDQLVSSLAGHLARGGVWVVGDYLHAGEPDGPADVHSAGEYFANFAAAAGPGDHQAIRDRGAAVANEGRIALLEQLGERLGTLSAELVELPPDHLVSVVGGKVMRLDDYLTTRVVEQVVHLDDLARSVGREPWKQPEAHYSVVIAVGIDVARRRQGSSNVIRALYRDGFEETAFPVL